MRLPFTNIYTTAEGSILQNAPGSETQTACSTETLGYPQRHATPNSASGPGTSTEGNRPRH